MNNLGVLGESTIGRVSGLSTEPRRHMPTLAPRSLRDASS